MDLADKISELKSLIERQETSVMTEEASKTAFVLPFMQALRCDIFNPMEVVPEYAVSQEILVLDFWDGGIEKLKKFSLCSFGLQNIQDTAGGLKSDNVQFAVVCDVVGSQNSFVCVAQH